MKRFAVLLSYAVLLSLSPLVQQAFGARVIPVGDFRFLGGQYFFNSSASSLSGNASVTIVPAVKFSDRFSLIPTYMGSYRGTKEVSDLAGGGTLFQDGQDHFLSVKGVYSPVAALKLKMGASYRLELLRETKDENWGKGLFDYRKMNTGVEAEYAVMKDASLRLGLDYFTLRFPNYESLESSVTSSGLGRELAGKNTLDCNNLMTAMAFTKKFGRIKTEAAFSLTSKDYPDQPVVIADGNLSSAKRKDSYSLASAGVSCPFKMSPGMGLVASLDLQYVSNDSTQGHYDATKYVFTPDYYDYTYTSIAPTLHFVIGRLPWAVSIGASTNRQEYAKRRVQNENGDYQGGTVYVDEMMFTLGITYPLSKSFKLRMVSNFIDSRSNMKYEKTFAYNYQTSNYLFGFSYEF